MTRIALYILKITLAIFSSLLLFSCSNFGVKGTGEVTSEQIQINQEITSIKAASGMNVIVNQGDKQEVKVVAHQNLHQYIKVEQSGNVLTIKKTKNFSPQAVFDVFVSVKNIESLSASSGSEINAPKNLKSKNLTINSSSGSTVVINLIAEEVTAKSSSGSDITLIGKTLKFEGTSSSGSSINAENLICANSTVKASSGSDISTYPLESLNAHASSGSDITYFNAPTEITYKQSSGGSVNKN